MTSKKDFLKDLAALAANLRQQIEAQVEGFETSAKASAKRVKRARQDLGYFAQTYFPHYVSGDSSVLHDYLYERLPKLIYTNNCVSGSGFPAPPCANSLRAGRKLALAAPRGEAKSTICSQIFVLWCIVHDLVHYVPIIQFSHDQAVLTLEAIKAELDSNPRLEADFPKACGIGRVWNAGVAITTNGIKVQALGSGTRLRGLRFGPYRPDLVVLDDIENDENVASQEQRDKLERWLNKAVLKLGPPDGSLTVLYIGTILHYDSVLARTLKKPTWESRTFKAIIEYPHRMDLWDIWGELLHNAHSARSEFAPNGAGESASPTQSSGLSSNATDAALEPNPVSLCSPCLGANERNDESGMDAAYAFYLANKIEMDKGAVVSWPAKRPLVKLMTERYTDRSAFDSEFQNDPISTDDAPFGEIPLWVAEDPNWVYFGAIDPSLGKTGKGRDPSAILVGGFNRSTGVLDVVEARIAKRLPDKIIEDVIALQAQYKCLAWAIETVQFQEFLKSELVKRGAARGIPIPAVPVTPHKDKQLRIEALQPHVMNGLIRVHPSQTTLLQQLRHWPKGDHDDGPDALEMLWTLAHNQCVEYRYEPVRRRRAY